MAFMATVEKITTYALEEHDWVTSKWENIKQQTFRVIWENGSNLSNMSLKMSISALGRLENQK